MIRLIQLLGSVAIILFFLTQIVLPIFIRDLPMFWLFASRGGSESEGGQTLMDEIDRLEDLLDEEREKSENDRWKNRSRN